MSFRENLGKTFHYKDERLNADLQRLYARVQDRNLDAQNIDSRSLAVTLPPKFPERSIEGNRLKGSAVGEEELSYRVGQCLIDYSSVTITVGDEVAGFRLVEILVEDIKGNRDLNSGHMVGHLWSSTGSISTRAPIAVGSYDDGPSSSGQILYEPVANTIAVVELGLNRTADIVVGSNGSSTKLHFAIAGIVKNTSTITWS